MGTAEVEAAPGRIRVRDLSPGLDGSVVLRYHSVPCLKTSPPVALEPASRGRTIRSRLSACDHLPAPRGRARTGRPFLIGVDGYAVIGRLAGGSQTSAQRIACAWLSPGKGYAVPAIDTGTDDIARLGRLSNWVFWCLWALIVLIAAAFYYEKAADHRSAFVRWRPQVLKFWAGVNIYDKMIFPNPPIMPITLHPLMVLADGHRGDVLVCDQGGPDDRGPGRCSLKIVRPPGRTVSPRCSRSLVLLLSLRPILGDLHHGNNNLLILFLVVAMFYAWRRGHDIAGGAAAGVGDLVQGDAGTVFPFISPTNDHGGRWARDMLGLGIFLIIVPSAGCRAPSSTASAWVCGGTAW